MYETRDTLFKTKFSDFVINALEKIVKTKLYTMNSDQNFNHLVIGVVRLRSLSARPGRRIILLKLYSTTYIDFFTLTHAFIIKIC